MAQRLEEGFNYTMQVEKTEYVKSFKKKSGEFAHRIDVYFRSDQGIVYKGEYISEHRDQYEFIVGQTAHFYVSFKTSMGDEIMPIPNPDANRTENEMLRRSMKVGGESYALAIQCATTLVAADIQSGNRQLDPHDLLDLYTIAENLNAQILEMQRAQHKV